MFKKVLYNTGSQIIGKAVTASATLFITLLIGRSLGPAGFGDFTKIFVFVGYFYTFADFGLNAVFIKLTLGKNTGNLIRYLVGLRLIIAIFLAATAIVIAIILPYDPVSNLGFSPLVKTGIFIASLTIVTQALFTSANALFQKNLRYDLSTIAAICGTLTILVIILIATIVHASILVYVAAYVVGGTIFVIVAYYLIKKLFRQSIRPLFSKDQSGKLLVLATPIGLALIFNLIYFRIDVLILSYTRSSYEVGLYGLAYQFFEAALAIPIFFANALYPGLAAIYVNNKRDYRQQIKAWLLLLTLFSLATAVILFIVSFLIPRLYDPRFTPSGTALQILAAGMPFFFISALLWHLLIIQDKQKLLIPVYALGAVFNLVLNLIFIPIYGFLAAAAITVVSEALILLLLAIVLRYNLRSSNIIR